MVAFSARRSSCLLAWLMLLAVCPRAFAGREFLAGPHEQVQPDQLLVGLKLGADIGQILSAIAPQAVVSALAPGGNVYLLKLPKGIQAAVSKLLAAHPLVDYVEPNRIRTVTVGPPNDTSLTSQWNLTTVHAQQAWNYLPDFFLTSATAGTNRVKVAILDTGLDCSHPDFINAGGASTDSAQGGQILYSASEAIQNSTITTPTCGTTANNWSDDYGHGTHVAGIVAAATNNATGVASLGFPLQLIIIKTSDNNGNATDFQVAEGIDAAVAAGAQVISMSLGGAGYSQTMQNSMDKAWAKNVLVIAAAGNTGNAELIYPGDGNHVLAVAATDDNNAPGSFSSYGNWVRIAAPGVNIYSTLPTYSNKVSGSQNYGSLSGTSMATPHVSALAGLLFAANPGISVAEVAQRIQQTAQSPHPGWDQHIGYGVINAFAALANIPGPFTLGALTGQVIDSVGAPVSGAVVTAGTQSYMTADDAGTGATDGLFRINLSPGTYPVTVTDTGQNTVTTQATVVAGADTMLTIQFGISYGSFTGTVTYNGVGVAGAVVAAAASNKIFGTAITDSSGNYTLSVQPGSYTLTASAPNYIGATSGSQTLTANGTVTVNLALGALGAITGTITDLDGLPVPNANVAFASAGFNSGAVTGSNGTYTSIGLPAGTYTVTSSASGYTNVSVSNVNVANNISTLVNLNFSTGVTLSTGLAAYWPFNDGAGTQALDQSGNNHTATLSNTTWTTGLLFPSALQFNVNESYAVSNPIPFSGPFSASVWVNSTASEIGLASLVYESNYWSLGLDSTGTKYKFIINHGTGSTGTCSVYNISQGCAQGGTVATGWHFVTATYDGANALLYVDSALVASDTFSVSLASTSVQIGTNWGGAMQSMRIYSRVLTAPEVSALYSQGSPAALNLSKTADAATVAAGNAIGFTLTASNPGTGTAQVVALNDPLPPGTGIAWSISPAYSGPGSCGIASGTLSCSFGSLSSGAAASVHVAATTTASSCGSYSNTATASATNASSVQASATATVQCGQSITFAPLSNQAYGTTPFTVSATASSGLPVSFDSQTTLSVCTVSGSTVTLVDVGTCTIEATQAGNTVYTAAAPMSQSFQVTQGAQNITFGGLSNHAFGSGTFNVSATASSGLSVSFNSATTLAVCTVSGATVTLVAVGMCTVQATQAGNTDWSAAPSISHSFQVTQGSQSINFGGLSNRAFGSGTFNVSATASSGLSVSFNSQTTLSVCTVSGATVTLVAVGTCTVQATQAGDTNWSAAAPVNRSFQVTQGSQTINFGTLQNQTFGTAPITVSATASSGLSVSFNSQTTLSVCTVSGSTVTLVAVGTCTVQATQAGNTNFSAAPSVNQNFQVTQGSQNITFAALQNQTFGTAPITVSATASSGLSVSFNSQTTLSVCTVSGSTVTLVAVGTCTVQATQAGNTNWTAATPMSQSFQVTQGSQSINFAGLPDRAFGSGTFTVSATASSGLSVSFNSQTTLSVCTVSGSTVTLVAVGTCTVQATQAGSTNWSAATPVSQSFQVTQGSQSITFGPLLNQAFGTVPFTVSATASSGLSVSFNSQTTTGVCTVSGSTVTLVAVGTCTVQATQVGNTNWSAAAPASQSFQVTQGSQTINFGALTNHAFGSGTFTVSATASSGLSVSFNSQTTTGVCTVSGSTVTLVSVGTCTVQATQAGTTNWAAATPVSQSFQVTQGSQTITFGTLQNQAFGIVPFTVSATANSALPVSFNSQTTLSVCTVSGSSVTLVAVGTCTVQATQSGTANWSAATPVSQSFQVTQGSQTIAFAPLANQTFGAVPFTVSATASSGLAVSFNSQTTPGVCTVSGSTVTLISAGLCTVQATQSGTANWSAATSVSRSFQVTQASQTITFGPLVNQTFGAGPFTVSATASSGQPVSFNSQTTTGVCTVSGSTVTLVAAGPCTIQATQAGNADYSAATPVNQSFTVTQASQTINFAALPNQTFGAGPFTVSASATSGLAVSFNSQTTTGVCTVSGTTVTLVAVGACTVQAKQSGNTNYSAAPPVSQSFTVTQGSQTINFPAIPNQALGTVPFALSATASSGLAVNFSPQTPTVCTISNGTVTLVAIGTCTIQAAQPGNSNYTGAQSVSQSFTVTAGIGTASVNSLNFPNTIAGNASAAQTFTFQNSGNTALTIASIAPAGPDAANYRYTADASRPCPISPATLAVSASCTLDVTFTPTTQGAHNNAQIAITDNSGNVVGTRQTIGLTGTGIVLTSISVTGTSASLSYGASEPFTATGAYSDNSTASLTGQVTWSSSVPSVAGINASGVAAALLAGQTNITASLSSITSNSFQLTVVAGAPATITATAGSGQSTTAGTAFASSLQALVKDGGGDPVPNASVTFTAPANGASGTFANGLATFTATTNASGIASAFFTANSTAGAYSVSASVAGAAGAATFSLTNVKAPVLSITEQPNGTFIQGQSASYTVTVSNAANAGPTSGAITVTESAPAGLTVTGLNGGGTWTCTVSTATCTTNSVLNPGATSTIVVTVLVGQNAQGSVSNGVSVTGGAFQTSTASTPTVIVSACAVTLDNIVSVSDLQQVINEALGVSSPANDLNADGMVNIVDLQIVTNAALGGSCKAS